MGLILGRDALAASAIGTTSFGGVTYYTTAENITGLLAPGSTGYVTFSLQFRSLTDLPLMVVLITVSLHVTHRMWILIV